MSLVASQSTYQDLALSLAVVHPQLDQAQELAASEPQCGSSERKETSRPWWIFLQRIGRGNRRGGCAKVLCVSPHDIPYKWLTPLAFLGMLRTARSGGGESAEPMCLHGAVAQQTLSILREKKGGYVRLAEIAEVVAPWSHLSRPTIDVIADTLAEGELCVRHGFQNRIGAGGRLHELEALRLLWGNFPARSREVSVRASGREIGVVPAGNLVRLKPGVRIRFAGRVWTVANLGASGIDVVPARHRACDAEIGYLGKGLGVDPAVLEVARQTLPGGSWELDELAKSDAEELETKWRELSRMLAVAALPFARERGGCRYLTFAGTLVNEVICRWHALEAYEVDDLCIWSPRPIEFGSIPKEPELLADHAAKSLIKAGELTIFQSMLPESLLHRDMVEPWCRVPCYAQVLQRLVSSEPVEIASAKLKALLA